MDDCYDLILADYGNIPASVLRNLSNKSTIKDLLKTNLRKRDIYKGLIFLIHKRFINVFVVDDRIVYTANSRNIFRRLYFPFYLEYIDRKFHRRYTDIFLRIMVTGICSILIFSDLNILKQMVDLGLIQYCGNIQEEEINGKTDKNRINRVSTVNCEFLAKKSKTEINYSFVRVIYEQIEKEIISEMYLNLIENKYSIGYKEFVQNLCVLCRITKKAIEDFITEKMLTERTYRDYAENFLFFAKNDKILEEENPENLILFKNRMVELTKKEYFTSHVSRYLSVFHKRFFNCILLEKFIDDRDIVQKTLIESGSIRKIALDLQSLGYISLSMQKKEAKTSNIYSVDMKFATMSCILDCLNKICNVLPSINAFWDHYFYYGTSNTDDNALILDVIEFSKTIFVLQY